MGGGVKFGTNKESVKIEFIMSIADWGKPRNFTWLDRKRNFDLLKLRQEELAAQDGGLLPNHELWRLAYYRHPYLIRAEESYLQGRLFDITTNLTTINSKGKLSFGPSMMDNSAMTQKWVHAIEEFNSRGGIPSSYQRETQEAVWKHFENGLPVGTRLFKNYTPPKRSVLVKYQNSPHIEAMYNHGEFRIANAAYYKNFAKNSAINDNELEREFFLPTYRDYLDGTRKVSINNNLIDISSGDVFHRVSCEDYYLFCTCSQVDFRMPSEFGTTRALVIKDPDRFTRLLSDAVCQALPKWTSKSGQVRYIDPYIDYDIKEPLELTKHFSYGYQKEHRIVWYSKAPLGRPLEPIYVKIGPMKDYADLI